MAISLYLDLIEKNGERIVFFNPSNQQLKYMNKSTTHPVCDEKYSNQLIRLMNEKRTNNNNEIIVCKYDKYYFSTSL